MADADDLTRVATTWRAALDAATVAPDAATTLRPPPALPVVPSAEREPAGEFRLGAKLGQGGMGVVYSAVQAALDREVAVKTLAPGALARPELVAAFLSEARVTARLDHPNVVPIYALARDARGELLLGMKRVEGRAWSEVIRAEPPSDPDSLRRHVEVFRRVLDAVAFSHERGVLHRDLKPANVMVGTHGQVYVLDWGLALELGSAGSIDVASSGGTPAYMAPEMAGGEPLSRATDVYLLGAILHELLVGRPPHQGPTVLHTIASAVRNAVLPLRPAVPAPAGLVEVASRCLATLPSERFDSAAALRDALDAVLSGERARAEAEALAARAARLLDDAPVPHRPDPGRGAGASAPSTGSALYRTLFEADALLQTALQSWPGSPGALELRGRLHGALVRSALAAGDLSLAGSFLERARSLGAAETAALEPALERARRENDPRSVVAFAQARRRARLVSGSVSVAAGYAAATGVALALLPVEQRPPGSETFVLFAQAFAVPGAALGVPLHLLARRLEPRRRGRYLAAVALAGALGLLAVAFWVAAIRATNAEAGSQPLVWVWVAASLPLAGQVLVLAALLDERVRALFPSGPEERR